ncbi:MAG: hypothetical protein ACPGO7_02740 [Alphaproteobacteria bacterium]
MTQPRFTHEGNPGGAEVFLHPCSKCGKQHAPFGYGVRLRGVTPQLGRWYCYEHWPDKPDTPIKTGVTKPIEPVKKEISEPQAEKVAPAEQETLYDLF